MGKTAITGGYAPPLFTGGHTAIGPAIMDEGARQGSEGKRGDRACSVVLYLLGRGEFKRGEVYLNRYFPCIATMLLIIGISGCSASGPEITRVSISDQKPVTGQRVLIQVLAVTDNPPFKYIWNCSDGRLEGSSGIIEDGAMTDQYYVYWTAPDIQGTYTVTCKVVDDDDQEETIAYAINVGPRQIIYLLNSGVVCMAKDSKVKSGGIWVAVSNDNIQYYSSTTNTDIGWGKDFFRWASGETITALQPSTYSSYYYVWNIIWTARNNIDSGIWEVVSHGSGGDTTYTCDTCTSINSQKLDGNTLWVGSDNGLFRFNTSSTTWGNKATGIPETKVKDLYVGEDLTCVATTSGIYYSENAGTDWTPVPSTGDTTAVTTYQDTSGNLTILGVTAGKIMQYNKDGSNPFDITYDIPEVVNSLDKDPLGNIWCGKYSWNGTTWSDKTGIDDPIESSIVSPEGLLYLRTTQEKLIVWGKSPQ